MTSLRRDTFVNVSYLAGLRIVTFFFQGVTSIILSRNLTSSDYGIVGFAMIFVNFLRNFSDMGINNGLVQGARFDSRVRSTAFTIRLLLGIVAAIVACLAAIPAAEILGKKEIVHVIRILSLNFLVTSFVILPIAMLKRQLAYRKLMIYELTTTAVSSLVSVCAALIGFGFWSIVSANILSTFAAVMVVNVMCPIPLSLGIHWDTARDLMKYGGNIFLSSLVVFIMLNVDNFIVGTFAGAGMLGCYAIAFNWGAMICTILQAVVLNVLFPTFSRMYREGKKLESAYLDILEYVSFAAVLVNFTLLIYSKDFLIVVLGHGDEKWLPALTSIRILCVYGIVRSLLEPLGQVILAIGRSDFISRATIIAAVVECIFIYPALYFFGIAGAATIVSIAYALQNFYYAYALKGHIDIDLNQVAKKIYPAFVAAPVALLPLLIRSNIPHTFFEVVSYAGLSAVLYVVFYGLLTRWKLFIDVKNLIFHKI